MKYKELKELIKGDLSKLSPPNRINCIKRILFNASFKITFWLRICSYLKSKNGLIYNMLYHVAYVIYKHNQFLTGIQVPVMTQIGKGLVFAHFSNIVVTSNAIIGENCIIYNGCTIGDVHGANGSPIIGHNVVIYPGSKIIENVKVGNNVVIGANAVVTKDIPDNSVAVGIPAKVISDKGQEYFDRIITRID